VGDESNVRPTVTGGAVFQSTALMLMYQSGALSGFAE